MRSKKEDEDAAVPASASDARAEEPAVAGKGNGHEHGSKEETGLVGVDAEPLPPPSREEIEALRRERDDLKDLLLRKRADFENYRKRVERDHRQAGIEAAAAILRSLVPTLDGLESALQAQAGEDSLREGLTLIQRDLLATLEGHGVVTQDPVGQKFDPQTHQALSHDPVPGVEEGTVVEVLRKGYFFKDRLLRPALVKVAKGDGERHDPEAVH